MIDTKQRLRLLERDNWQCQIRGPDCTGAAEELDHIEAKKMGGRHGPWKKWIDRDENLRWVCRACHHHRHSGGRVYV